MKFGIEMLIFKKKKRRPNDGKIGTLGIKLKFFFFSQNLTSACFVIICQMWFLFFNFNSQAQLIFFRKIKT